MLDLSEKSDGPICKTNINSRAVFLCGCQTPDEKVIVCVACTSIISMLLWAPAGQNSQNKSQFRIRYIAVMRRDVQI